MKRLERPESERCYDPACHRKRGHDVAPDWSKGPEYDEPGLVLPPVQPNPAGLDLDDVADKVEARLDNDQHERLCACVRWPGDCVTYGQRIPWSHSDVHLIVQVTLRVVAEASA